VTFIVPCWFDQELNWTKPETRWKTCMENCEESYLNLLKGGWSPQQARSVLPNSLKTEIVVTGNFREWRHFVARRTRILKCERLQAWF